MPASAAAHALQYSLICLDAAATNAEDGGDLELPPMCFVDEGFLRDAVYASLRPGGAAVCNLIGKRRMLLEIARTYARVFDGGAVLGIDPNYLIWGFKAPCPFEHPLSSGSLAELCKTHGLAERAPEIFGPILCESETYRHRKVMMGWVTLDKFISGLLDPEYTV